MDYFEIDGGIVLQGSDGKTYNTSSATRSSTSTTSNPNSSAVVQVAVVVGGVAAGVAKLSPYVPVKVIGGVIAAGCGMIVVAGSQ